MSLVVMQCKSKRTPATQPLEHSKASAWPPLVTRAMYLFIITQGFQNKRAARMASPIRVADIPHIASSNAAHVLHRHTSKV